VGASATIEASLTTNEFRRRADERRAASGNEATVNAYAGLFFSHGISQQTDVLCVPANVCSWGKAVVQRTSPQWPILTDAVEKPADDLTKVFQSSSLGVFLLVKRSVQLPWLDTIDAQATHATGMFSSGRQI
jgi:hypothetical protein